MIIFIFFSYAEFFHFVKIYSSQLMLIAAIAGHIFPKYSNITFQFLPVVLFILMFITLTGIDQKKLLNCLLSKEVWVYGVFHSFLLTVFVCGIAYLIGVKNDLLLAIAGVTATGSPFATAAIVRSLGFDPLEAIAMTIVSTLLMPLALYINLSVFQAGEFSLDLGAYIVRFFIFIVLPMILSYIFFLISEKNILFFYKKMSVVSLLLVFSFPFGIVSAFGGLLRESPIESVHILLFSVVLTAVFFLFSFFSFLYRGKDKALIAAITLGNRNVLLTYVVVGHI